jgi:hypothetical protein
MEFFTKGGRLVWLVKWCEMYWQKDVRSYKILAFRNTADAPGVEVRELTALDPPPAMAKDSLNDCCCRDCRSCCLFFCGEEWMIDWQSFSVSSSFEEEEWWFILEVVVLLLVLLLVDRKAVKDEIEDDDLDDDGISSNNGWGKDSKKVRMDSNCEIMTFLLYFLTRYFFFFFFYLPVPCRRNNSGKLLLLVVVVVLENLLGTRGRNWKKSSGIISIRYAANLLY